VVDHGCVAYPNAERVGRTEEMNTISIFLYLADVIGKISFIFVMMGLVLIACSVVWFISTAIYNENQNYSWSKGEKKPYPVKQSTKLVALAFLLFTIAGLIPSKDTMYLIAGSEIGETVVSSPEAKEILKDIRDVIGHQLNELKGKKQ
jgi:hypothetical protein